MTRPLLWLSITLALYLLCEGNQPNPKWNGGFETGDFASSGWQVDKNKMQVAMNGDVFGGFQLRTSSDSMYAAVADLSDPQESLLFVQLPLDKSTISRVIKFDYRVAGALPKGASLRFHLHLISGKTDITAVIHSMKAGQQMDSGIVPFIFDITELTEGANQVTLMLEVIVKGHGATGLVSVDDVWAGSKHLAARGLPTKDCPAGLELINGACSPCTPGHFKSGTGSSACQPCRVGKVAFGYCSEFCVMCPCGEQPWNPTEEGNCKCKACPQPQSFTNALGLCDQCNPGEISVDGEVPLLPDEPEEGSDIATKSLDARGLPPPPICGCTVPPACSDGRARNPISGVCENCPPGSFSINGDDCSNCPPHLFAATSGSTQCSACPCGSVPKYPGQEGNTECRPCDEGETSTPEGTCKACEGWTTPDITEEGQCCCAPGKECTPGSERGDTPESECVVCGPGYYSADGLQCLPCPLGTFARGAESTQCELCDCDKEPLHPQALGNIECTKCGQFEVRNAAGFCEPCPGDWERGKCGNEDECTCEPINNCQEGYVRHISHGVRKCVPCRAGTYFKCDENDENCECLECDAGNYSEEEGSVKCKMCPCGKQTNKPGRTGATECLSCAEGHFTNNDGRCQSCTPGSTLSCSGFFDEEGPVNDFLDCEGGACEGNDEESEGEQPRSWSKARRAFERILKRFLNNWYKHGKDQFQGCKCVVPPVCGPGYELYSFSKWGTIIQKCQQCKAGEYSTDGKECLPCPSGTYTNCNGASVCIDCACGHHTDGQEGATGCEPCATAESAAMITIDGQCHECDCWTEPAQDGSCTCVPSDPCLPGQQRGFSTLGELLLGQPIPNPNDNTCHDCPPGSFSDGNSPCAPCPIGLYAPYNGMYQCIPCPCGQQPLDADGVGNTDCEPCAQQAITYNGQCTPCPPWHFAIIDETNDTCICNPADPCEVGQIQTSTVGICEDCPPGTYASADDTLCLPCPLFTYSDSPVDQCSYCPCGTTPEFCEQTGNDLCVACPQNSISVAGKCAFCSGWRRANSTSCECQEEPPCDPGTEQTNDVDYCSPCQEGRYSEAGEDCRKCEVGKVNPLINQAECKLCPCGKQPLYPNLEGNRDCVDCESPRAITGIDGKCFECPQGTFPERSSDSCKCVDKDCAAGHSQDPITGECSDCLKGTYSGANDTDCYDCPAGKVSLIDNSADCQFCGCGQEPANPALTGQSSCVPCESDEFTNSQGFCEKCTGWTIPHLCGEVGTSECGCKPAPECGEGEQRTATVPICEPCPPGSVSADDSGCSPCPPGLVPNEKRSKCVPCPCGKQPMYSNQEGQTRDTCVACPVERSRTDPMTGLCVACGEWEQVKNCKCKPAPPCGPGTYRSPTQVGHCLDCEPGTFSNGQDNLVCTPCPEGQVQPYGGKDQCRSCPCLKEPLNMGTGNTQCKKCPFNHIQDPQTGFCTKCEGWTKASEDPCECMTAPDCEPGYEPWLEKAPLCKKCQPGSFSLGGTDPCSPCPQGTFNNKWASDSCERCPCGTRTQRPGEAGNRGCKDCTWGISSNGSTCIPCPAWTYPVTENGQCSCEDYMDCPTGYVRDEEKGPGECTPCPIGTHIVGTGAEAICAPCPQGTYTDVPGSSTCMDCDCGYEAGPYVEGVGNYQCNKCGPNSVTKEYRCHSCTGWQIAVNDCDICECQDAPACPPGYENGENPGDCRPCGPGSFSTGGPPCELCPPSTFSSGPANANCTACGCACETNLATSGSTSCAQCPTGWTTLTEQGYCVECPWGERPVSNGCGCVEVTCPANKVLVYQNGVPVCRKCPAGSIPVDGKCQKCEQGTYASSSGQTECVECPCGEYTTPYANGVGSTGCQPCQADHITGANGQCRECEYWTEADNVNCVCQPYADCPPGQVRNPQISGHCKKCPPGTYTTNQDTCIDCPLGTYNDQMGQAECFISPCGNQPANPNSEGNIGYEACGEFGPGHSYITTRDGFCHECDCWEVAQADCTCKEADPCNDGYVRGEQPDVCIPCPSGSFSTNEEPCQLCPAGTYSCAGASTCEVPACGLTLNCLTCPGQTDLDVVSCGPAMISIEGECFQCEQFADTTESVCACTFCYDPTPIFDEKNRICVADCPEEGFFLDSGVCRQCHEHCQTCFGEWATDCISCNSTRMLGLDGRCVEECPPGQAPSADGSSCGYCDSSCLTCFEANNPYACVKCQPGLAFLGNVCVSDCGEGYFISGATGKNVCTLQDNDSDNSDPLGDS